MSTSEFPTVTWADAFRVSMLTNKQPGRLDCWLVQIPGADRSSGHVQDILEKILLLSVWPQTVSR